MLEKNQSMQSFKCVFGTKSFITEASLEGTCSRKNQQLAKKKETWIKNNLIESPIMSYTFWHLQKLFESRMIKHI
jgi:hypothetical protein